jgi:hypothetical protein
MASTHERLEHAEHAGHAAHDPFDRRVAVSMAIIAACLAGVSTLGHRKHNDVLRVVGEANRYRTEAAAAEVQSSNQFARYQSKRSRVVQYEIALPLAAALPADVRDKTAQEWKDKLREANHPTDPDDDMKLILKHGRDKAAEAKEKLKLATEKEHESEHDHHQADRLDVAHLLAEVGLVVCSLALLTKKKPFWYIGMAATAASLAIAGSAYLIQPHAADHATADHGTPHVTDHTKPDHTAPPSTMKSHATPPLTKKATDGH